MSTSQFDPPQQSGGGGNTILVIVLAMLFVLLLVCGGLCAGCYIAVGRAGKAIEKGIQEGAKFVQLAPAYVEAHQAAASHPPVIERLGEPIEAVTAWKRQREGDLNPAGETMQFDIKGPKGTGIVSVVATLQGDVFQAQKITVTFADGSVVDVPRSADESPPAESPAKP